MNPNAPVFVPQRRLVIQTPKPVRVIPVDIKKIEESALNALKRKNGKFN